MTTKERVAHRRKLNRMRQKTWRDKRKNALSLVPLENLELYKGHRLGTVVHSILEEKVKASKRKKKQYIKVKKNPRLHAEKMHKDSWRKRVNRAYHGVFKWWKKKISDESRILKGATTLKKELEAKLDKNTSEFTTCKSWRAEFFFTNFYDRLVADFDLV